MACWWRIGPGPGRFQAATATADRRRWSCRASPFNTSGTRAGVQRPGMQKLLENLRDPFDRRATGLILIGMPGIDRSLSRHPQLYSRIGFAHQYRTVGDDELAFVLTRHWAKLGLTLDLTDSQAVAAVGRITRGNFRLVHRLFAQVARVMRSTTSPSSPATSSRRPAGP